MVHCTLDLFVRSLLCHLKVALAALELNLALQGSSTPRWARLVLTMCTASTVAGLRSLTQSIIHYLCGVCTGAVRQGAAAVYVLYNRRCQFIGKASLQRRRRGAVIPGLPERLGEHLAATRSGRHPQAARPRYPPLRMEPLSHVRIFPAAVFPTEGRALAAES